MSDFRATVRAVFNNIEVLAWAIDRDGVVLLSEGKGLGTLGYSPGQMVGHNLFEAYSADPGACDQFRRALAGESFATHSQQDGLELETRYAPMRDERGEQTGVVGLTLDVTAQRRAQRDIAAQTAALREQAELLDLAHDAIMVRRLDGTLTFWNRGAERMFGHSQADAIGRDVHALLHTTLPAERPQIERDLLALGYWEGELTHTTRDGRRVITSSRWVLRRGEGDAPDSVLEIDTDITARREAEAAEARRQQEIIRAQALAIEELSTPLIPITDEILVMPLIGTMDSVRAKQVMHSLLAGLAASRGKFAILDITGVPVVDTAVANAIIKAAHAARLLGASVILTGIRPEVAQTLVHIQADLGDIITRGTLQSGIRHALGRRDLGA